MQVFFYQFAGGSVTLVLEQSFESEVDEDIEWLITLFRLGPDQSALVAIEEEGGQFVGSRGSRQLTPIDR